MLPSSEDSEISIEEDGKKSKGNSAGRMTHAKQSSKEITKKLAKKKPPKVVEVKSKESAAPAEELRPRRQTRSSAGKTPENIKDKIAKDSN